MFALDATSDGKVDIVGGPREVCDVDFDARPSRIDVLAGDGRGHFRLVRRSLESRLERDYEASAVADVDGDGDGDLVGLTARFLGTTVDDQPSDDPRRLFVASNDGNGRFRARTYPLAPEPVRYVLAPPVIGSFIAGPALDVAVEANGDLQLLTGNRDGSFGKPMTARYSGELPPLPPFGLGTLTATSFNGDAVSDLFLGATRSDSAAERPYAVALMGEGDGHFRPIELDLGADAYEFEATDVDDDGRTDVVALGAGSDDADLVALAQPDGTFSSPERIKSSTTWRGDLDSDGQLDRIATVDTDTFEFNTEFQPGRRAAPRHVLPTLFGIVAIVDVDGDSRLDVLSQHSDHLVALLTRRPRERDRVRLTARVRPRQGSAVTCIRFRAQNGRRRLGRRAAVLIADHRVKLDHHGRGRICYGFAPRLYDAYLVGARMTDGVAVRIPKR